MTTQIDIATTSFELSAYQVEIVNYLKEQKGNLLINAVAGSGKTSTLMLLLEQLQPKDKALLCAFNVAIAEVLQHKIQSKNITNASALNFHKLGFRLISQAFAYVKKFKVDSKKTTSLMAKTLANYATPEKVETENTWEAQIASFCTLSYLNLLDTDNLTEDYKALAVTYSLCDVEENITLAISIYLDFLERTLDELKNGLISFDDMVAAPYYLKLTQPTYNYIFVDECQDLNKAQIYIALAYSNRKTRLFFVGDRKQAIYGFTGALANNFEVIPTIINDCNELPLSVCYRCGIDIVLASQKYNKDILPYEKNHTGKISELDIELFYDSEIITNSSVVLARKNSSLLSIFFNLLKRRKASYIVGSNVGQGLISLLKDLKKEHLEFKDIPNWVERYKLDLEVKNKLSQDKEDKLDCILMIVENCISYENALDFLDTIFQEKKIGNALELSSVHKSKGKEYNIVYLYDKHLPLTWANQLPWQYEQEINLCYVAYTRAIHEIIKIS